ncbi:alpha/beta hydrolase [Larkinella soli]|uniref:alpha/beta hydrolase n=1 Tax=Larkinella soli TaxID=1770527 RepID=UPI000FFCB1D6|nr:alpha/beta hydrolase family protein [Larkinella soli]
MLPAVFRVFVFLLLALPALAQESRVFDDLSLPSTILKKEKKFALYLPAGYETSRRSYPVLYLLHGGGDTQIAWLQSGNLQQILDKAIAEGKAAPMIVVMPDAEMTFYMNNAAGKYQYEDFFIKELIPFIEKNYRCRTEKNYRAVAGLSMGGFGSLLYSLHHPDLFGSCAALSAAVRTDDQIREMPLADYLRRYRSAMGDLKEGDNRITDFWNQNSILNLVQKLPENRKKAVRFYLDCGDDDQLLYKGNSLLHNLMRDLNIPHEYRVRDGGHTWEYWRTGLPAALEFITQSFR